MSLVAHPDGRQLLQISRSTRRDDGVYECLAGNAIATVTTSCTLTIACESIIGWRKKVNFNFFILRPSLVTHTFTHTHTLTCFCQDDAFLLSDCVLMAGKIS